MRRPYRRAMAHRSGAAAGRAVAGLCSSPGGTIRTPRTIVPHLARAVLCVTHLSPSDRYTPSAHIVMDTVHRYQDYRAAPPSMLRRYQRGRPARVQASSPPLSGAGRDRWCAGFQPAPRSGTMSPAAPRPHLFRGLFTMRMAHYRTDPWHVTYEST